MQRQSSKTFELTIRFVDKTAVDLKRQVLEWLEGVGITGFVESYVDGLSESELDEFGCDDVTDSYPIVVYDFDMKGLKDLSDSLLQAFPGGLQVAIAELDTQAWQNAWSQDKASFETKHFVVTDDASQQSEQKHVIFIHSKAAFGDGRHATTIACLEAIENQYVGRNNHQLSFLDVGCGSAVLAVAAYKLGFGEVLATEIDESVLEEARGNVTANHASIELFLTESPKALGRTFDVLAANILVPVLHELMPEFADVLSPQGTLHLAGFIERDLAALRLTADAHGFLWQGAIDCRGWLCATWVKL